MSDIHLNDNETKHRATLHNTIESPSESSTDEIQSKNNDNVAMAKSNDRGPILDKYLNDEFIHVDSL